MGLLFVFKVLYRSLQKISDWYNWSVALWVFFCLFGWGFLSLFFFPPFELRMHKSDHDIGPDVAVQLQLVYGQWVKARVICVKVHDFAFLWISRNFAGLNFILAGVCKSRS